jgi:hypothetical protein
MARSAVNKGVDEHAPKGNVRYEVDDGGVIYHDPDDGAVVLAQKLLNQIDEVGVE